MRTLKLALAAVAAFAFNANAQVTGMGSPPGAEYQNYPDPLGAAEVFHGGGVAACDGCHVMHNASAGVAKSTTGEGQSVQPWTNVTNAYLLQGSDQSSTCLICHGAAATDTIQQFTVADLGVAAATDVPRSFTPGGDFAWTNLDFAASAANTHGHNVVAADFPAFAADSHLVAPGGSYTAVATGIRAFGCSSCHDPHGRYRMIDADANGIPEFTGPSAVNTQIAPITASGSYGAIPTATTAVGAYRLLAGQNYAPASNPSYPFPNNPPIAVAPTTAGVPDYNRSEAASEVKVAYGTGMSEWCQNCHTNIHLDGYTTGVAGLRHPAGSTAFLHAGQYEVYNSYVSSGNMTGGPDQYTSLVPFEQGADKTIAELAASTASGVAITAGPTSAVMCLSCHRAHASAFDYMVRWDQNATFLTDGDSYLPGLTDRSDAQTTAGYYGRAYNQVGTYQRSLCNKCHGKD